MVELYVQTALTSLAMAIKSQLIITMDTQASRRIWIHFQLTQEMMFWLVKKSVRSDDRATLHQAVILMCMLKFLLAQIGLVEVAHRKTR